MGLLKSKKTWIVLGAIVLAIVVAYIMLAIGMSEELVETVVMIILGLGGLTVTGHTVADVVSMIKGLQKSKTGDGQ